MLVVVVKFSRIVALKGSAAFKMSEKADGAKTITDHWTASVQC